MAVRRSAFAKMAKRNLPHACAICSAADVPLEADHIVPLAAGGSNRKSNAQLLCKSCHKTKTATDIGVIAKIRRQHEKLGPGQKRERKWKQRLGSTKWKRKVSGEVVPREVD